MAYRSRRGRGNNNNNNGNRGGGYQQNNYGGGGGGYQGGGGGGGGQEVCKFWPSGRCKYGNQCKFRHEGGAPTGGGGGGGGQNFNSFLSSGGDSWGGGGGNIFQTGAASNPFALLGGGGGGSAASAPLGSINSLLGDSASILSGNSGGLFNINQPAATNNLFQPQTGFTAAWGAPTAAAPLFSAPGLGIGGGQPVIPAGGLACTHKDLKECAETVNSDFALNPWPFTCYGHAIGLANCVSGDISYEELHWAYVNGTADYATVTAQITARSAEMKKQFDRVRENPILASGGTIAPQSAAPVTFDLGGGSGAGASLFNTAATTTTATTNLFDTASGATNLFAALANTSATDPLGLGTASTTATTTTTPAATVAGPTILFQMSAAEATAIFNSANFTLGRIPEVAPPPELA